MDPESSTEASGRPRQTAARYRSVVLSRPELLARLEQASGSDAIAAAFRRRKPEAASDDELRELLFEIEVLKAIAKDAEDPKPDDDDEDDGDRG